MLGNFRFARWRLIHNPAYQTGDIPLTVNVEPRMTTRDQQQLAKNGNYFPMS